MAYQQRVTSLGKKTLPAQWIQPLPYAQEQILNMNYSSTLAYMIRKMKGCPESIWILGITKRGKKYSIAGSAEIVETSFYTSCSSIPAVLSVYGNIIMLLVAIFQVNLMCSLFNFLFYTRKHLQAQAFVIVSQNHQG